MILAETEKCVYLQAFSTIPTAFQEAGSLHPSGAFCSACLILFFSTLTCDCFLWEACLFMLWCIINFPTAKAASALMWKQRLLNCPWPKSLHSAPTSPHQSICSYNFFTSCLASSHILLLYLKLPSLLHSLLLYCIYLRLWFL